MIRPLSIVGIVVIAVLSLILQSIVLAQTASQSGITYVGPPVSWVPDLLSGSDGSMLVRFLELSTALAPPWLLEDIRAIYYALANWELEGRCIEIIAGLITIAYVFPSAFGFFKFIVSFLFRKGILEGTWHAYHYTRKNGDLILRYEEWKIKRNWQNRLSIKTSDPKDPQLKYKGFISKEQNHLLIALSAVGTHEEEVQMRFPNIIPTGRDISIGLAMGVDFQHKPQCLLRIMSREKLSDDEARRILDTKTMMKDGILSICEDYAKSQDSAKWAAKSIPSGKHQNTVFELSPSETSVKAIKFDHTDLT